MSQEVALTFLGLGASLILISRSLAFTAARSENRKAARTGIKADAALKEAKSEAYRSFRATRRLGVTFPSLLSVHFRAFLLPSALSTVFSGLISTRAPSGFVLQ